MATLTVQQAFALALQHHQAGRLSEAEQLYRAILAYQPEHADALHHLGLIAQRVGQIDTALELMRRSVVLNPAADHYYSNLGNAQKETGRLDEAIESYQKALDLKPELAEVWNNLGSVFRQKKRLDESIGCYRRALTQNPGYAEAHNNLGLALTDAGRRDEAVACYRRALELKPDYAKAHCNLGTALLCPGHLDEAIACLQRALALNPDLVEAHNSIGIAFKDAARLDEAIASFQRAIALKPDFVTAYGNLGAALTLQGRIDEAIAALKRAVAIDPTRSDIYSNLLFTLHYHPGYDSRAIADEHRRWNRLCAEPLKAHLLPHSNERNPERKLRIGYVSPDLDGHPVSRFLLPLLQHHDRQKFELFAYAEAKNLANPTTCRFQALVDRWLTTNGLKDGQLADRIREDGIDVLVDLAMHGANNRILVFARKPAPVQVAWLAYCSTTGLDTMDYRLSDPYMDEPGGDDSIYSEQTIRLPDTYWCYQPTGEEPDVNALPALENEFITFGCLNNFSKVTAPTIATWLRILHEVSRSRLLIYTPGTSHRQRFVRMMEQGGIDGQRLQFVGPQRRHEYFSLYHGIDIALDPFPYGGGTTTCDALWMGNAVVTLKGGKAVGRGGFSLLSNIGLPGLVASDEDEYVRIAVDLAGNLARLAELRASMRQRMQTSPLMDAPLFTRNMEAAYRTMWRKWCET